MIQELQSIPNPNFHQKLEHTIVIKLLWAKIKLGIGYADELHCEFRKPEHLLKVKVFDKDEIWSADLVELCEEPKFKTHPNSDRFVYQVCMDHSFTKQKGQTVAEAFKRIMNELGRNPKKGVGRQRYRIFTINTSKLYYLKST